MKLANDFFKILESSKTESGFSTRIELNAEHIIYTGHFPGQPVTPGVIQMQIVHELLSMHLGKELKLCKMSQCKFLKVLNPIETEQLFISIIIKQQGEMLTVKASGKKDSSIFFKLNASYIAPDIIG